MKRSKCQFFEKEPVNGISRGKSADGKSGFISPVRGAVENP